MHTLAWFLLVAMALAVFMAFMPALGKTVRDWETGSFQRETVQTFVLRFLRHWLVLSAWCVLPAILLTFVLIAIAF